LQEGKKKDCVQSNLKELFEKTKHILEKNNKKKLKLSDELPSSGTTSRRLLKGLRKQIIFNPPKNTTDKTKSTILSIVKKKKLNDKAANKSSAIKQKKKKVMKERTEGSLGRSRSKQKIKRISMDDGSSSKFRTAGARSVQANSPFIEPRYQKAEIRESHSAKHPAYASNPNQSSSGTFRRILTKRIQNINSRKEVTKAVQGRSKTSGENIGQECFLRIQMKKNLNWSQCA
jgi:hypothetical protein